MVSEFLVLVACATSKGCSDTANLYYNTHDEFRQVVEREGARMRRFLPEVVVVYVGPVALFASGQTANFRLSKYFTLEVSSVKQNLVYSIDL